MKELTKMMEKYLELKKERDRVSSEMRRIAGWLRANPSLRELFHGGFAEESTAVIKPPPLDISTPVLETLSGEDFMSVSAICESLPTQRSKDVVTRSIRTLASRGMVIANESCDAWRAVTTNDLLDLTANLDMIEPC